MTEKSSDNFPSASRWESEDSVASTVNHLWRAKWLLAGVFLIALVGIFASSHLLPDRFGVRASFLPPEAGKVYSLLSEPLPDRNGAERFIFDQISLFRIFLSAVQSASVKQDLYSEFVSRTARDDMTFSAFLDSVQFIRPAIQGGDTAEVIAPAELRVFAQNEKEALWLGKRYLELAAGHAIETLNSDFLSLRNSVVSALQQSADKMREDYSLESQQTLAALQERLALLEGVIELRRSAPESDKLSELSVVIDAEKPDTTIPVYLLSDVTLSSAVDVVARQLSQIRSRENPDLHIEGLANYLSRIKAAKNIELTATASSFYTEVLSPTLDQKLKSPKRFFLAVIGAIVLTVLAMIAVLLAPMVRASR